MTPEIPISWGELIDKITILEIKVERMADAQKLANVRRELIALQVASAKAGRLPAGGGNLTAELKAINLQLWDIEDQIRELDRLGDFGPLFVELARSVYRTNDRRAQIKREISLLMSSDFVEEKSYAEAGPID